VPDSPTYEQLLEQVTRLSALVEELTAREAERADLIAAQADRIAELERRLGSDSSNSSRPPGSDAVWDKKPAAKRSSRSRSGRKPGKQPGSSSAFRRLSDDPDRKIVVLEPDCCRGCAAALAAAAEVARERRQVVDVPPAPAPEIIEYQRVSRQCGCGAVTAADWVIAGDEHAGVLAGKGSPVRIGPRALARAALLTCGHYLPIGRARQVFTQLCGVAVSAGFLAGVRGRAATLLQRDWIDRMRELLVSAPVLHADETTGRAAGALSYVHVACTEYLTVMHVGGRSAAAIDAGEVLPAFAGVLVRDGYAGYTHLPAVHAWCGAHLIRDLRSISDADPDGQLWATAMADVLLDAHRAATAARADGASTLAPQVLALIRNHYLGALSHGRDENRNKTTTLARDARALISRFTRFEDMILRFATDLTVPFTNNEAERTLRPVKIQQRTSGGAWRTLQGLTDFAVVASYLDTATKWGRDKLDVLTELFTTGPWLPPALTPAHAA
jgi:transposase